MNLLPPSIQEYFQEKLKEFLRTHSHLHKQIFSRNFVSVFLILLNKVLQEKLLKSYSKFYVYHP